jgi:hypothetical protein
LKKKKRRERKRQEETEERKRERKREEGESRCHTSFIWILYSKVDSSAFYNNIFEEEALINKTYKPLTVKCDATGFLEVLYIMAW